MISFVRGFVVGAILTAVLTLNPDIDDHADALSRNYGTKFLPEELSELITYGGKKLILKYDNYIICSVSYVYIKEQKTIVGIGMIGIVVPFNTVSLT